MTTSAFKNVLTPITAILLTTYVSHAIKDANYAHQLRIDHALHAEIQLSMLSRFI